MRWTPRFVQPPMAAVTALIFYLLLKRERRAVAGNLRRVTGRRGVALHWKVYRVFYSFCDLMVSYAFVPQATHAQLVSMLADGERGAEVIDRCLAAGHGVIVWTAHLGNPEFASRLLGDARPPGQRGARGRGQARGEDAARPDGERAAAGSWICAAARAPPSNCCRPSAAMRSSPCRETASTTRVTARRSQFFGAPAEFPLGPFLLSQVSGAPVLPGFVVRRGWLRYRVLLGEPILPASSGNREEDQLAGLRQAVGFLEASSRITMING